MLDWKGPDGTLSRADYLDRQRRVLGSRNIRTVERRCKPPTATERQFGDLIIECAYTIRLQGGIRFAVGNYARGTDRFLLSRSENWRIRRVVHNPKTEEGARASPFVRVGGAVVDTGLPIYEASAWQELGFRLESRDLTAPIMEGALLVRQVRDTSRQTWHVDSTARGGFGFKLGPVHPRLWGGVGVLSGPELAAGFSGGIDAMFQGKPRGTELALVARAAVHQRGGFLDLEAGGALELRRRAPVRDW